MLRPPQCHGKQGEAFVKKNPELIHKSRHECFAPTFARGLFGGKSLQDESRLLSYYSRGELDRHLLSDRVPQSSKRVRQVKLCLLHFQEWTPI